MSNERDGKGRVWEGLEVWRERFNKLLKAVPEECVGKEEPEQQKSLRKRRRTDE